MECSEVRPGIKVQIKKLGDTAGMIIPKVILDNRRKHAIGVVFGAVPGHGGDVWFVKHEDATTGAYSFTEFDPVDDNSVDLLYELGARAKNARALEKLATETPARELYSSAAVMWEEAQELLVRSGVLD